MRVIITSHHRNAALIEQNCRPDVAAPTRPPPSLRQHVGVSDLNGGLLDHCMRGDGSVGGKFLAFRAKLGRVQDFLAKTESRSQFEGFKSSCPDRELRPVLRNCGKGENWKCWREILRVSCEVRPRREFSCRNRKSVII